MKKILTLMLCALTIAAATSCNSSLSDQEKAVKAKVKELKKAGWKVVGDEDLTTVVSRYMETIDTCKTDVPTMTVFIGCGNCENIESGKIAARNDAPTFFTELLAKDMKDDYDSPEWASFCKNFETIYAKKIAEELISSFYVYRKLDNDIYMYDEGIVLQYEVLGYFLISQEKCVNLMLAAQKEAADLVGIDINKLYSTEQESNQ